MWYSAVYSKGSPLPRVPHRVRILLVGRLMPSGDRQKSENRFIESVQDSGSFADHPTIRAVVETKIELMIMETQI